MALLSTRTTKLLLKCRFLLARELCLGPSVTIPALEIKNHWIIQRNMYSYYTTHQAL